MKILFITPRVPFPPFKGDSLRSYHFIRELAVRHEIDLITFHETDDELGGLAEMRKYCRNIETVRLAPPQTYVLAIRSLINLQPLQVNYYYCEEMKAKVSRLADMQRYDIVHVVLQRMMPYVDNIDNEKLVLDQIDALSLNMKRRASAESNLFKKIVFYYEYINMKKYEQNSRRKYRACLVTSEVDKRVLEDERIQVVPNGVDTVNFHPQGIAKDIDFIFTGNMSYFPNEDAATCFCRQILPEMRATHPAVVTYIVGIKPSRQVQDLADREDVVVTGYVEDIRWYLNRARIFVAPLRSGSGIQNKILEAMACGLPVVTTSYGNAGIGAVDGKHLLIADDPLTFARHLRLLLGDAPRRHTLGQQARQLAETSFSWAIRTHRLETVYNNIMQQTAFHGGSV